MEKMRRDHEANAAELKKIQMKMASSAGGGGGGSGNRNAKMNYWNELNNGRASGTFSGTFRNGQLVGNSVGISWLGLLISLAVSCAAGFALANPAWFWRRSKQGAAAAAKNKRRKRRIAREREREMQEGADGSDGW